MTQSSFRQGRDQQAGFTIIEVIVTLVVTVVFLGIFFQTYLVVESQRVAMTQRAKASNIAYSNLRKFTTRPPTLTCDSATMDLTAAGASSKPGKLLGDESNKTTSSAYGFIAEPGFGSDMQQRVVAYAPQGCASFADSPVQIVSKVIYKGETVVHATYVK